MLKFFRIPFAQSGDKTAVPDAVDVNGFVSYTAGYGFDYQRQKTDPAAKNIERDKMNEIFFDITTALAELQSQGIPDFITSALNGGTAYSYGQYAVVRYSGDIYVSLVAANTATPADLTKWALLPVPSRLQQAAYMSAVAGGTVDAITAAFAPAIAALPAAPGTLSVFVRAGGANATTTPTFKADGTTAKTIVKGANQALVAGDIAGAGHWLELQYDATLDKWVLQNPATGVTATGLGLGYMLLRDERASGVTGGASAVGNQTRVLNTVVANTISGASLASNQITLPAGTYRIRAHAPAIGVNNFQSFIQNITDAVVTVRGTSENGMANNVTDPCQIRSFVEHRMTLAGTKVFELRMYCNEVHPNGLGAPVSQGTEVYSVMEIVKE